MVDNNSPAADGTPMAAKEEFTGPTPEETAAAYAAASTWTTTTVPSTGTGTAGTWATGGGTYGGSATTYGGNITFGNVLCAHEIDMAQVDWRGETLAAACSLCGTEIQVTNVGISVARLKSLLGEIMGIEAGIDIDSEFVTGEALAAYKTLRDEFEVEESRVFQIRRLMDLAETLLKKITAPE